jgi:hypothetical protein
MKAGEMKAREAFDSTVKALVARQQHQRLNEVLSYGEPQPRPLIV